MREGWEYKSYTWSEVLTIINGKNQSAVLNADGKYPIYGSGGIMGYANDYLCPEDTVVIGRKGNINKPLYVATKFWNVDTAFGLDADRTILSPKYLFYFCLDYNFERHNKAVTIPSLTKADLLKIKMKLPSLNNQLTIVSELDQINELIRLKKEQLKDYDDLAQSIFYDMFGDPVENDKGWEVKKVCDICDKISDGPFGSNLKSEHYVDMGIRVIRLQNIGVGKFIDTDKAYITGEYYQTLLRYTCRPGEIIIGTLGSPNLRACKIPNEISVSIHKADCVHIVPNNKLANADYWVGLFNSPTFVRNKSNFVHGQTRGRISYGQIKEFQVPLPPLPLQQTFAARITQIEQQKAEVQKAIADLETLLASRMQYWFE